MSEYFAAKQQEYETKCRLPEVVALEEARFTDKLVPEHEEAWAKLMQTLSEARQPSDNVLKELWEDESAPRAIRDRLMLLLIGTDETRTTLTGNIKTWASGMRGGVDTCDGTLDLLKKNIDNFDSNKFIGWLLECEVYQTAHNLKILSRVGLQAWICEAFDKKMIDETSFHQIINEHRLAEPKPSYAYYDDEGYGGLDPDRFPLVFDIYFNILAEFHDSTRAWAAKQAKDWLAWKSGELEDVPEWLKQSTEEQGLKIFQEFTKVLISRDKGYKSRGSGKSCPNLEWSDIAKAVDYFGMVVIWPSRGRVVRGAGENREDYIFHWEREAKLDKLKEVRETSIQQKGIIVLVEEAELLRQSKDWVEPLFGSDVESAEFYMLLVKATEDSRLISLAEKEIGLAKKENDEYEEWLKATREESRRKHEEDPAEIARKVALESLTHIVSDLRDRK